MSHLCTAKRPMTSARRDFVHGKLQPAEKAGLSDWALRAWMVLITLGTIFYIYHGAS